MSEGVVVLGFDAMDPAIVSSLVSDGRLPAFASFSDSCASCAIRNPVGLFVGTLWSTFFTARSADRTGFHCWEEIVPGGYERRLTSADSIRGRPFWETLSDAGKRVAVLDVPHSRAGVPLERNGVQVSEWGCHDRHFGLRSSPPELAREILERFGEHPVLGVDPWSEREFAPDDYVLREGPLRTGEEEEQLLAGLLAGAKAKGKLSAEILSSGPWDLFMSVFGEPHSVGHQSWHVHDLSHPRHDSELLGRIGDPVVQVYEQMDMVLAEHLAAVDPDATVLVLLSHGIGPHNDGTHLLPEILRRLDAAYSGAPGRSWQGRALGGAWRRLPDQWRSRVTGPLAQVLAHRLRRLDLGEVREHETEEQRRAQRFFMSPNNFVVGGVRINLQGREQDGRVHPGRELDELCERLRDDLTALVNVPAGTAVIHSVQRTDSYYRRDRLDALPDLFLEWNHEYPIETIWSPRFGMIHGSYKHWRTGDHRPGGRLLVRSPGIAPQGEHPELAIEDLAPSIAARLGVLLPEVDGVPARWLSGSPEPSPRAATAAS